MAGMSIRSHRPASLVPVALACALAAAAALVFAYALENWDGLVPCALCLLERWPYRIALVLGLLALVVPGHLARLLLWPPTGLGIAAVLIAVLASLASAGMHVAAARYFAIPLWYGLLFPIGYTLCALLAVDGITARRRGRVAWKGRVYPVLSEGASRPPSP